MYDAQDLAHYLSTVGTLTYVKPKQQSDKGGLSRLVEDLVLNTTLSYADIVAKALEQYPSAKTTTRSVASVACVMRTKLGYAVPHRTKQNG